MTETADLNLLEKAQALIAVERDLTATMVKVEPWLTSNTLKAAGHGNHYTKRVRPIPTTMDQVHKILAVSRNFASRTSAPAGWNPAAPVFGFSTPNPLPHQLRGGALAALQLERAHQAERDKKRRRQEEEKEAKEAKARLEAADEESTDETGGGTPKASNPKATDGSGEQPTSAASRRAAPPVQTVGAAARPRANRAPQQTVLATTMNLSDSSSSSDDDDDDSD